VRGLEPGPAGGAYALWLSTEKAGLVAAGSFAAEPDGTATFFTTLPHDLGRVERATVSAEPDAELGAAPRGPLVLVGEPAGGRGGADEAF
jgi:hypothetical protein